MPTKEGLLQAVLQPATANIAPYEDNTPNQPLLPILPKAGHIVSQRQESALGIERIELSNGVTVLLKGAVQYVAGPRSTTVQVAVPGPAWTAQAGSGDVLAGICATLLASGMPAWQAAVCAASAQALTATANPGPYPPQDVVRQLPATIAGLAR